MLENPLWYSILGVLVSIVAVASNGLVIYLITTKQRLHTKANCFILSLAVADLCVGVFFYSSHSACLSCEKGVKTILKRIRWFFLDASLANLCAMAVDRYIAISKPMKYLNLMRNKRIAFLISTSWLSSLILNGLPLTWSFSDLDKEDKLLCDRIFLLTVLLLFELLPCVILATATGHIFMIARKHNRQTTSILAQLKFNEPQHASVTIIKRKHQQSSSGRVINIVVAIFIFCYALDISLTFCYWFQVCYPPQPLYFFDKLFLIANSALNPIVYFFFKKDIKAEMKKMLRL